MTTNFIPAHPHLNVLKSVYEFVIKNGCEHRGLKVLDREEYLTTMRLLEISGEMETTFCIEEKEKQLTVFFLVAVGKGIAVSGYIFDKLDDGGFVMSGPMNPISASPLEFVTGNTPELEMPNSSNKTLDEFFRKIENERKNAHGEISFLTKGALSDCLKLLKTGEREIESSNINLLDEEKYEIIAQATCIKTQKDDMLLSFFALDKTTDEVLTVIGVITQGLVGIDSISLLVPPTPNMPLSDFLENSVSGRITQFSYSIV